MSSLRQQARGRPCQIRVPGICNHNAETTVGCHYRLAGISGVGHKAPDLFIAWGCSDCHRAVDMQYSANWTVDDLRIMHLEGVIRTQFILLNEGHINVP